ncbi:uncharacterized protein LOC113239975 [Hyposmocoma kahamanoa]|uniref:uncharacterized protein LOC113239975 n=1 Tax=Hyposmocoma kahamanoa TaxID=1477025 RepID=UPI000E6D76FA|nr:uncharacterized protein LOC113239975 [Hyposmocoma kahamanoa]
MASPRLLFVLSLVAFINGQVVKQTESAIEELEKYIQNKKPEINQRYRLHYHVAAPVGWINDPNGFSYYKGEYHLFYQFYPYDSVWGPMHWGHVTSPDLVNWKWLPTALIPGEEYCFSGSAVVADDTMVLIYTAHIDDGKHVNQSQYLAFSEDGVKFVKYEGNPVIPRSPNGSPDFRDPKAWRHGEYWYVIIGSKTDDGRGRVLLYRSSDLFDWEFLTVLGESDGKLGYMWECPDFFELDGKFVLLMSPQGIEPQGDRYKNLHQTGYIIGSFNYATFEFIPEVEFQELDYGHDFYAAQTTENDGRRYVVGWFNMWEAPHLEETDGWSGAMTIVREMELYENRILMKPVKDMASLREEEGYIAGDWMTNQDLSFDKTAEILFENSLDKNVELLLTGIDGGQKVWLRWSPTTKKVSVDRGNNDVRQVEWVPTENKSWRIFLDASTLELFCGEGEVVFSSRVYPDGGWKVTNLSNQTLNVETFKLKRSIPV